MRYATIVLFALCAASAAGQKSDCLPYDTRKCPAEGCAEHDMPEAEANRLRNATYTSIPPRVQTLSTSELAMLQEKTDSSKLGRQGFAISDRTKYRRFELDTSNGRVAVGELTFVSVVGVVVGLPRAAQSESTNCRQLGREKNSYRMHISSDRKGTEYDSIIVVITPNMRALKQQWDFNTLAAVTRSGRPVRITGPLFYDSKHMVNSDPQRDLPNEPRRLSLWEIHPVVHIELCTQKRLDRCFDPTTATWESLEGAAWLE